MNRKKKFETGLEELFSTFKKSKDYAQTQKPATTDKGTSVSKVTSEHSDEQTKAMPMGNSMIEHPEMIKIVPEQPQTPDSVKEAKKTQTKKQPLMSSRQSETQTTASDTPDNIKKQNEQLVVFALADEYYGVGIDVVESIIKLQPIVSVPHTPTFIKGVINFRGVVLPVADLRIRFGLLQTEHTKDARIVVVEVNGTKVGIVVDKVTEVLYVPGDAIESLPSLITKVDQSFIKGIAKVEDRLIIMLKLSHLFSQEEQTNLEALQHNQGEKLNKEPGNKGSGESQRRPFL